MNWDVPDNKVFITEIIDTYFLVFTKVATCSALGIYQTTSICSMAYLTFTEGINKS